MGGLTHFDYSLTNSLKRLDDLWKVFDYRVAAVGSAPTPDYECVEKDDAMMIYVRTPGYGANNLSLQVQDGMLKVHAELPEDRRKTRLVADKIDLEFTIGTAFKVEEANHENGILEIRLSRLQKSAATEIPIKVG